jgi:hypothetical protein
MPLTDAEYHSLTEGRVSTPGRIAEAYASRRRPESLTKDGMMFVVAADHTARGMVGVDGDCYAMADRRSLLDRMLAALDHPTVNGVLASADIMDDLVVLGALEGKVAVGTMNRGGLAGATWELDDRFTAFDVNHLERLGLEGGKMLLRIDDADAGTAPTIEGCARAVQELGDRGLLAMVEPIPYTKDAAGRAVWDDDPLKLVRAVGVCSALGSSSARTWLKVQATSDIARVAAMTTQPLLLLGGAPGPDPERTFALWEEALQQPTVRGLVVGRALLYPTDGDVASAVDRAAALVETAAKARQ